MCRLTKAVTATGSQEEVQLNGQTNLDLVSVYNHNTNRTWHPKTLIDNAKAANSTHPLLPLITVDPDTDDEETVALDYVPAAGAVPAKFVATFKKPHGAVAGRANTVVVSRGNPGPWMRFVPSDDKPKPPAASRPLESPTAGVVLYSEVD